MPALVLNCTLKPSPALSNTEALTDVVIAALREKDVQIEAIRVVDRDIPPGVETDLGNGDEWPASSSPAMRTAPTTSSAKWPVP